MYLNYWETIYNINHNSIWISNLSPRYLWLKFIWINLTVEISPKIIFFRLKRSLPYPMAEIDFILNIRSRLILENIPKKHKHSLHLSHTAQERWDVLRQTERWDVPSLHHHNRFHYKSTSPSQPISLHRIRDVIESAPPSKGRWRERNQLLWSQEEAPQAWSRLGILEYPRVRRWNH